MQITNAVHTYLARQYEQAVDARLDVEAIRRHLQHLGILRTPAQLKHDLDHTYAFAGYWYSHPAPPPLDVAAVDLAIEQMTPSELKLYDLAASVQPAPTRKRINVRGPARREAAG